MKSVSKIFRTDIVETHALRDFDLSVNAGEFVAITGHSGSGKTTLLNIASAISPVRHGRTIVATHRRVKPSALQSSLPTPWWTKKSPSGSYFVLTARSFE